MRIRLPDGDSDQLDALIADAEARRGKGAVSRSAWLQGAIQVAADDEAVAARVADAVPDTGRGGVRPGAGRPRRPPEGGSAADPQ